jgi:hypothetical protein
LAADFLIDTAFISVIVDAVATVSNSAPKSTVCALVAVESVFLAPHTPTLNPGLLSYQ